jgi:hypothetical protein
MSETVPNRTTIPRPDHTHWECKKPLQSGMRCSERMPMSVNICTKCGRPRGNNCVALTKEGHILGNRIDVEGGEEVWLYNVMSNGYR